MFVDRLDRPAVRGNGRQDLDANGSGPVDQFALGHDIAGVLNDDRDNGHPGLHCQVKRAFLERCKLRRYGACALRRYAHGFSFDAHRVDERAERFDGLVVVLAVVWFVYLTPILIDVSWQLFIQGP